MFMYNQELFGFDGLRKGNSPKAFWIIGNLLPGNQVVIRKTNEFTLLVKSTRGLYITWPLVPISH